MVALDALNHYIADKSYVSGYTPSQADVTVFKSVDSAPSSQYPHALRWYKHIASYEAEFDTLAGEKSKSADDLIPAVASTSSAKSADAAPAAEDDDDEVDLFGSDDDEVDEAAEKLKQERLAAYAAKKATKPKTIAKSVVTLDVKPWDDETDMAELEKSVRSIEKDGLVWGLSKLVAIGYGVKKLQITLVIEDEKISLDELQEQIAEEFEEYVQSSDVQAMQKL
ncbi:Translation elongation factor 1 beta [Cystobasidiomycetes sp. EMM_F5]